MWIKTNRKDRGKAMKNAKMNAGNRKRIVVFVIAIIISILAGMLCASLIGRNIKQCAKDLLYGYGEDMATKKYSPSDIQFKNYEKQEQSFVSVNNDPQIILSDINDYVKNVTVYFSSQMQQAANVEIYFSFSKDAFTPEQSYIAQVEQGAQSVTFSIGKKVADLRLDIGTEAGVQFDLDSIILNDNVEGFSISHLLGCMRENISKDIWFDRVQLLSILFFFLFLHFIVGVSKLYNFLFDKRWAVAGVLLLFLVCNRYNGDSIAMYDSYIQTGEGNDYIEPVLGEARAIRSDEWLVDTPISMSSQYLDNPYGKYNTIIRGTKTISTSPLSFASIGSPLFFPKLAITKLFGYDYGISFGWYGHIFLTLLFCIEFFLIITNRNKLLSACGAFMFVFSSYFLWWGFPSVFLGANASVVCAYHFIHCRDWKKKIPLAIGTSIFTANFVMVLYPAWQVPLGYMVLVVLVYLIHDNWTTIKSMSKAEWITIVAALILCGSIVISYLFSRAEYTNAVMQTEYPGSRVDYGGFSINKLFNYIPAVLFAFKNYGNPSEAGTCIGFFPVPMLLAAYTWIKSKKKDWLVSGLLLVGIYLTVYTTVGLPPAIAKYTLMTFSTSARAVDILGYLQVVLFIRVIATMGDENRINRKAGIAVSGITACILVGLSNYFAPGYMSKLFMILMVCVLSFIFIGVIARVPDKWKNAGIVAILLLAIVTGGAVRPINKGSDAITSKPLAKEITKLVREDKDAKWLAVGGGIVLPSFAVACGAPTINSVNIYPNMELWKKLDPEGCYNEVYNRYAHIDLQLVEDDTSMELLQADSFILNLSYEDIEKTEAKYIVSQKELSVANQWVTFEPIYNESGSYIYQIQYN